MSAQDDHVLVEDRDGIRLITLNRPDQANALTAEMMRLVGEHVVAAENDPAIRVIVITAAGRRHFSGGIDLKAVSREQSGARPSANPFRTARRVLFEIVLDVAKPTIAAINGLAFGGGLELALACDMRVLSSEARLALPEARRGAGAQFGTVLLSRLIPPAIAFEMLFTGQPIEPDRAYQVGLVNRVCPPEAVLDEAMRLAGVIAENAPLTLQRMKQTATRGSGMPLAAALRLNEGPSPYQSEDRLEGARAFVEKRKPDWKGQ